MIGKKKQSGSKSIINYRVISDCKRTFESFIKKEIDFFLQEIPLKSVKMLFVTLVSVLLVSAPHFAQAQSVCTQEVNTDYFGNDLSYVFVADVGACCNLCSFYPNCQSWTFVSTVNACWLKSTASPTKVASAGRKRDIRIYELWLWKNTKFLNFKVPLV